MPPKVGTAGWGYLGSVIKEKLGIKKSGIEGYAEVFEFVEVNYTFYKIPRESTVKRWAEKARKIREDFEFSVKAYRGITHEEKFKGKAYEYFEKIKHIAKVLGSKIILFQSPPSFKPTEENLKRAEEFFSSIDRDGLLLAWEVRWKEDWKEEIVKPLFSKLDLIHAVDPLRQRAYANPMYYRLHGFGKRMYDYTFSTDELEEVAKKIKRENEDSYVVFNNYNMYEDAVKFKEIWKERFDF